MPKKYFNSVSIAIDHKTHNLGPILKQIREAKGFSLKQVADSVGIHPAYIWRLETGIKSPGIYTVQKLIESGLGGELEIIIKY